MNKHTTHWCHGMQQTGPVHECPFCGICPECGNDHIAEGARLCTECLFNFPDHPLSNSKQASASSTPAPQRNVQNF